jgi:hypothetical protein
MAVCYQLMPEKATGELTLAFHIIFIHFASVNITVVILVHVLISQLYPVAKLLLSA